ncbi:MAG: nitrate reductase [Clostridia bacterium]|nr:nitrate reductase [Clostridia bacterium]
MHRTYVNSATGILKKVLLSAPSYLTLEPIDKISIDWLEKGTEIDRVKAAEEHAQLIEIYKSNGVEVETIEPVEGLSSMTYSRDFGFNLKEGYVLGRFKENVRRPETEKYREKLEELDIPMIACCTEGYLEGGDFWQLDERTLAVGMLQRSDEMGIENIRRQLKFFGYEIIEVEAKEEYLHLDMIFNIVGEKTAVAYWDGLPKHFKNYLSEHNFDIIKIEEEGVFRHFCNLQALGNKRVISLKANYEVNCSLRERGFEVFELDCTEILKAGGGPHCMTFPLMRE